MFSNSVFFRRGLNTPDGETLPDHTIFAAYNGSTVDMDLCHLSIRKALYNTCMSQIRRLGTEYDLETKQWFTATFDSCGRYADDLLDDWKTYGDGSYDSLYDILASYSIEFRSRVQFERKPNEDDFAFQLDYGMYPKSMHQPPSPTKYQYGEGHGRIPDLLLTPLVTHLNNCKLVGMMPHSYGCGKKIRLDMKKLPNRRHKLTKTISYMEKESDISTMVKTLNPAIACVLNTDGHHDIVLNGCDTDNAFKIAKEIEKKYNTPVTCLVLNSDKLLHDINGNHAKHILKHGVFLRGSMDVFGETDPPRPAAITDDEMTVNLDKYGFEMIVLEKPGEAKDIRPEYIITASHFWAEARWYLTAVAVLLVKTDIDWDLLTYLAELYGFTGSLRGIADGLCELGHLDHNIIESRLKNYKSIPPNTNLKADLVHYV